MDKIAFHLGNFTIYWYGILVALGFLAGLWTSSRRAVQDGIRGENIVDLGPWLILGAIVGTRDLYVISYWPEEFAGESPWEIFNIRRGGLVFYGGLIGASLAGILFVRFKKLSLWKIADILAPSIALGHAFGRIGCLMNGCCYGRVCQLPWAIRFPNQSEVWRQHWLHGLVGQDDRSAPVHPTQVYEASLNLALYLLLAWLYRRKRFDGQIFALYLLCYAVLRAFVESFRGDYTTYYLNGHATPAQVLSIVIFAAGALLWWVLAGAKPKVRPL